MVSIIIPTFNYAAYISETLNSVKHQTFSNWECIVVDDGSTDTTREIVENFATQDARFKYVYQENKGVSVARNCGVKIATGQYIQFLDGDDLLQENKLKSQIEVLEKNSHIDIVYNNVLFFEDSNPTVFKTSLNGDKKNNWMPKISDKGADVIAQFSTINFMVINAPLLRKTIFSSVGFFNEKLKALEDWDFWMRCALADCYFHFNESSNACALVRVHGGSLSTQKKEMNEGHFLFLQNYIFHKKMSWKYRLLLAVKYVELFWESFADTPLLRRGAGGEVFNDSLAVNPLLGKDAMQKSFFLTLFSVLMFPFYLLIKLIRFVKQL